MLREPDRYKVEAITAQRNVEALAKAAVALSAKLQPSPVITGCSHSKRRWPAPGSRQARVSPPSKRPPVLAQI